MAKDGPKPELREAARREILYWIRLPDVMHPKFCRVPERDRNILLAASSLALDAVVVGVQEYSGAILSDATRKYASLLETPPAGLMPWHPTVDLRSRGTHVGELRQAIREGYSSAMEQLQQIARLLGHAPQDVLPHMGTLAIPPPEATGLWRPPTPTL